MARSWPRGPPRLSFPAGVGYIRGAPEFRRGQSRYRLLTILVTGVAGFIGYHLARALLERGETVLGLDSLSDYYDPALKQARLDQLAPYERFRFARVDIADKAALERAAAGAEGIERIVHLAAQAGVRYSLVNPGAYVSANLVGHFNMLELARGLGAGLRHFVYASSSSVYGGNTKLPFAVADRVDRPVSLYAATKRADELMTHAYASMFGLTATGLRYFTVYGPWGRPDMSAYIFVAKILAGEPIPVFNFGDMSRDYTYIDDVIAGTLAAMDRPPAPGGGEPAHRLYNLGNHRPEPLLRFIETIEAALGAKAKIDRQAMPPGDVKATYADIDASRRDLGFAPKTAIEQGIPRFVDWYREYHRV